MIITHIQAKKLINSKKEEIEVSLDLGKTLSKVKIKNKEFIFEDKQKLTEKDIKKLIKKDTICFYVQDSSIVPIKLFLDETNKFYKLVPSTDWPTLEISGIRMHVTRSKTPKEDTEETISFIKPVQGTVLDTCTGLGYTAIMASHKADEVYTFEIDSGSIEMQKLNPWSQKLFDNKKIKRHKGDIFELIKKLPSNFFDRIIHDPPRLSLATLLYSKQFYAELYRVAKKGALLYHYTGDPGSRNRNMDIRKNIRVRLAKAGFKDVEKVYNGLVAIKIN